MSLQYSDYLMIASRLRGFTLIEILVAVVVLAIGLLGLAGLQATSMRFNNSAYQRSQATSLVYDIFDRMRANRQAALAGAYDNTALATTAPACTVITPTGTLAQQDVQAWRNGLACVLPLGNGSIVRNGTVFTVTVQWDDKRGEAGPQRFQMDTDL